MVPQTIAETMWLVVDDAGLEHGPMVVAAVVAVAVVVAVVVAVGVVVAAVVAV